MDEITAPDSLNADIEAATQRLESAIKEAYLNGFAAGVAAANKAYESSLERSLSSSQLHEHDKNETSVPEKNKRHPNSSSERRFAYGAVANAFRIALRRGSYIGATRDGLIAKVSEILGEDVSDMSHADTIKRLRRADELVIDRGLYKAGRALKM